MTIKLHSWVDELLEEASAFDETLFPPLDPVGSGERVLGEASEGARKVFALARYYGREVRRFKVESGYQQPTGAEMQIALEMDDKEDLLMEMLWCIIMADLKDWTPGIGMREGWKVVRTRPEPAKALAALLGIEI
jgi:hypothetical protein